MIANCTNAITIDPNNVKAFYRRGIGHQNEKNWELALKDFQQASTLSPNDKDVKKELSKVKQEIQKQKDKEKKMYSKMFG